MLLSNFGSTYVDSLILSILMKDGALAFPGTCLLKKNHRYLCQFAADVPGTILGMLHTSIHLSEVMITSKNCISGTNRHRPQQQCLLITYLLSTTYPVLGPN